MSHPETASRLYIHPAWGRSDWGLLLMLWLATAGTLSKDINVGGLRYGDEAAHAMDGVLIRDWVAAGPAAWLDPMGFAERQYAHYPALGIGTHYPPGFAVVEAVFFAILGISAPTSRCAVVFFGILAASGAYVLVRMIADRTASLLAAAALVTMPATVEWGRQTMLEVPTMAALAWCAVAFTWYCRKPNLPRWLGLHACMAASLLFKQTAVFIFAATAFALFVGSLQKLWKPLHAMASSAVALTMLVVVTLSLGGHGSRLLHGDATYPDRWSWVVLTGYLEIVPSQVGWPVFACAILGVAIALGRPLHKFFVYGKQEYPVGNPTGVGHHRPLVPPIVLCFLAAWFLACYVMLTAADFKYNRYLFVGLLPFAAFAGLGMQWFLAKLVDKPSHNRPIGGSGTHYAGSILVAAVLFGIAWSRPVQHRPDYGAVVLAHRDQIEGRAVLFSGLREGDFVFAVRQHLPWRRAVVVRGSKLFYTCNGRPNLDFVSLADSAEAVSRKLLETALPLVFIERENRVGVPEEDWLRQILSATTAYRHRAEHHLMAEQQATRRDVTIDLFESTRADPPSHAHLEVYIPRSQRYVQVPLRLNGF